MNFRKRKLLYERVILPYFCILFFGCIRLSYGIFECTFDEPEICDFSQDQTDDQNFLHHSGRTPTAGTGPDGDHTTGSGHYMYLEASDAAFGSTARLISPIFNGSGVASDDHTDRPGILISFWVHMDGEEVGKLRVLVNNSELTMQNVTTLEGNQGSEWVKKNVTVAQPQHDFQIIFEAQCGASTLSDIAIDDVTVDDDVSIEGIRPSYPYEINCTFEESGLCGFTQANDDNFNLIKKTASNNNNPYATNKDHTFKNGTGTYMTVDAYRRRSYWWRNSRTTSNNQRPGQTALLMSPLLSAVAEGEEPACLLFWYHMHGDEVGQLRVYVKNETSDDLGDPVWTLAGERGKVWRAAEIRIDRSVNFQVAFEFVAGNLENMAIDDISLTRYECPGEHPVATEPSVNCDFSEVEICYYRQEERGFQWKWTNRATDSLFTGPSNDHTRGDELGFYMHIDSEFQVAGSSARLYTPVITAQQSPSCFEFWYHMYGSHIGKLSVYARFNDTEQLPRESEWSRTGNQGNAWHRASFMVANMNKSFEMIFEGVLGTDYRTDIAIDDVRYYPDEDCPEYTTPVSEVTTLPPGLPSALACDFEADFCNFTQAVDDIYDWQRIRASWTRPSANNNGWYNWYYWWWRSRSNIGPNFDHTRHTDDGYYVAFVRKWGDQQLRKGDRSRVLSPLLAGSDRQRCLTFYMYKQSSSNSYLNVFLQEYGGTISIDPLYAYFWQSNKQWWEVHVDIAPSPRPFNIVFEAVLPYIRSWYNYMLYGIDDVTVTDGKCRRDEGYAVSCDFEADDVCGYSFGKNKWFRNQGPTPSRDTGPSADHTYGNIEGHYMYYEASQPANPGEYGDLYSPRVHFIGKRCVRFYYHASGNDTRRLELRLKELTSSTDTILTKLEGTAGKGWQPVNVDIDVSGDFQFVFRAFKGRGYRGDIAIDDVILFPHPCANALTETSCDFELGRQKCGYENSPRNSVDWMWYDAVFGHMAPITAYSWAGSNSFMYVTSEGSLSETASSELYSGHLTVAPDGGDTCLCFVYIIESNSTLTIDVYTEDRAGQREAVGTVTDGAMLDWNIKTWSLVSSNAIRPFTVYRIIFSVALNVPGIVAIDNVVVSSTACSSLGEKSEKSASTRVARSGMTAGVTIFVILVVIGICILAVVFRSRIRSMIHRCSQTVTEMNYKRHDVGFVNDDMTENVEIPTIVNRSLENQLADSAPPSVEEGTVHVKT